MTLLAGYGRDDRPRTAVIPVFAQIDPLPGAEKQFPMTDGNCHTASDQ